MKRKNNKVFITILITVFLISICTVFCFYVVSSRINNNKKKTPSTVDIVKDGRKKGYSEDIKSKNIISFSYSNSEYNFSCDLKNNDLYINSSGSNFKIDYISKDKNILTELQNIVDKYKLYVNNGYEKEVSGLPKGYGDTLLVEYDSGEKIWKYSNQIRLVDDKVINEIFEVFHKNALDNGYEFDLGNNFTDEGISKEYLQGTWEGKFSNNSYKIEFNNNYLKIYQNDILTDTHIYKIVGNVVVNFKLKKVIGNIDDYNNYEPFRDIVNIRKENDILYAYFNDYSKCELTKKE